LAGVFKSSGVCPLASMKVCADSDCAKVADDKLVKVSFETMTLSLSLSTKMAETNFYLQIKTVGDQELIQKFTLEVYIPIVETFSIAIPDPNTLPSFESALPTELEISVTKTAEGEVEGDSVFEFNSPKAVDAEDNDIKMEFSGLDGLTGSEIKMSADNSFRLEIDKSQINEASETTLEIILGDSEEANGSTHSIVLKISFEQQEPEEVIEEESEEEVVEEASGKEAEAEDTSSSSGPTEKASVPEVIADPIPLEEVVMTYEYVPEEESIEYDDDYVYEPYVDEDAEEDDEAEEEYTEEDEEQEPSSEEDTADEEASTDSVAAQEEPP